MSLQRLRLASFRLQYATTFAARSLARLTHTTCRLLHEATPTDPKTPPPDPTTPRKASTPVGRLDDKWEGARERTDPQGTAPDASDTYKPFPEGKNPTTGEIGGPRGPEPTRYGDWERKGRVIDF